MLEVILCSYKGEKYIEKQIESIRSQKTAEKYSLDVFDDEIRKSGSATLNFLTAINEAPEADFYMLSDQDDIWHSDKIEKMVNAIKKYEGQCGTAQDVAMPILVFSDAVVVDEELNVLAPSFVRYEGISPERTNLNQLLLQNQVTGAACIFNKALRDVLKNHAVPKKAVVHDQWIALVASALGKIYYLDEALYDYRQHTSNLLGAKEANAVAESKERLSVEGDKKAKANYKALYEQAAEFLEIYGDDLTQEQRDICYKFSQLPNMTKSERVKTIMKYGFTYNKFYRTAGELLFI